MTTTETILIILLGLVVISAAVYFAIQQLLKKQLNNESITVNNDAKFEGQKVAIPLRLQAYERSIILLERIRPNNMVMRLYKGGMNAFSTQSEFVKCIRTEFEHNLSQQLYLSDVSWAKMCKAREDLIQLIQLCSNDIAHEDDGTKLCQLFMAAYHEVSPSPIDEAIASVKKEMRIRF